MITKRIYTLKLAKHLEAQGYKCLEVVPDTKHSGFYNFLFEDTEELNKTIALYMLKN